MKKRTEPGLSGESRTGLIPVTKKPKTTLLMRARKQAKKAMAFLLLASLVATSPISDLGSKDLPISEAKADQGQVDSKPIELPEERTETTTSYQVTSDKKLTEIHSEPIRFLNPEAVKKLMKENSKPADIQGAEYLIDYDASLRNRKKKKTETGYSLTGYAYENTAGDKKHYFPETLSTKTPIRTENGNYAAMFAVAESQTSGENQREAQSPTSGTILAGGPVFEQSLPGRLADKESRTDIYGEESQETMAVLYGERGNGNVLRYESLTDGIKETIYLDKMPESNQFSYELTLQGSRLAINGAEGEAKLLRKGKTTATNPGEDLLVCDEKTKEPVGLLFSANMNDATGKAYSEDCHYEVTLLEEKGGMWTYELTLTASAEYLQDAKRTYPVEIDPTLTWIGTGSLLDTYVQNGTTQSTNYYTGKVLTAGYRNGSIYRTLLQGDSQMSSLMGRYVASAKLVVYEDGTGKSGSIITAKNVTASWTPGTVTWANQPSFDSTAEATVTISGTAGAERVFDLTSYMRKVANGTYANRGICLAAQNESATTGHHAGFHSTRTATSAYRPKLIVEHYDGPTPPSIVRLSKTHIKKGETPTLYWEGIQSASLAYVEYSVSEFQESTGWTGKTILPYSTTTRLGTAANGSKALPSTWDEGCYVINVRGVDNGGIGGPSRDIYLHIDGTAPVLGTTQLIPGTSATAPMNARPVIIWSGASDAHFARVEVSTDAGKTYVTAGEKKDGEYTISTASKQGLNQVLVRAVDQAGNTTPVRTYDFYYDGIAPKLTYVNITASSTLNYAKEEPTITWKIEEDYFREIQYRVDGVDDNFIRMGTEKRGSFTLPSKSFPTTGLYNITLQIIDKAGNLTYAYLSYYFADYRSSIQGYQPKQLLCQEQWDGTSRLSWECIYMQALPQQIRYEVHRSTQKDFTPSSATLLSKDVRENQFLVRNNTAEQTYYYKVRANLVALDGSVSQSSLYATETQSRTVSGELTREMGTKSYRPYLSLTPATGSGSMDEVSGNFHYQTKGISVPSKELSVEISLQYDSSRKIAGALGTGWRMPYEIGIKGVTGSELWYQDESGAKYLMQFDGGAYRTKENPDLTIVQSSQDLPYENWVSTYQVKQKENLTYHLDASGRLMLIEETNGDYLAFHYQSNHGNLSMIRTKAGRDVAFLYDEAALAQGKIILKEIQFPDGTFLQYQTVNGQLIQADYKGPRETGCGDFLHQFTYGNDGRLSQVTDGNKNPYRISYSGEKATTWELPNGDQTTLGYDTASQKTYLNTFSGGQRQSQETIAYDGEGKMTSRIDPAGITTWMQYRDYLPIQELRTVCWQEVNGSGIVETKSETKVISRTGYDDRGNVLVEIDQQNNQTEYTYANTGESTKDQPSSIVEMDADGTKNSDTKIQYDTAGNEIWSKDVISGVITDTNREEGPEGAVTETEKEYQGEETVGMTSSTSVDKTDAQGNLISSQETSGTVTETTEYQYDTMGRLLGTKDSKSEVSIIRSPMGEEQATLTFWNDGKGTMDVHTKSMDRNGNITYESDPQEVKTETKYDAMNRVIKKTTTKSGITTQTTSYEYTNETVNIYDGRGGSIQYQGASKTVVKNGSGQVISILYVNGLGQTVRQMSGGIYTDYTYDQMGHQTLTYVMGTSPRVTGGKITYQVYDEVGNVTQILINPEIKNGQVTVTQNTIVTCCSSNSLTLISSN